VTRTGMPLQLVGLHGLGAVARSASPWRLLTLIGQGWPWENQPDQPSFGAVCHLWYSIRLESTANTSSRPSAAVATTGDA
jgi:hypothetical protein